jgi:hypothetical protein
VWYKGRHVTSPEGEDDMKFEPSVPTVPVLLAGLAAGLTLLLAQGMCLGTNAKAQNSTAINLERTSPRFTELSQRGCLFPSGGWTALNCSNLTAATTTALAKWTRYVLTCEDDSYISFGGTVADSGDGILARDAWLVFPTSDGRTGVSCLNKTVDSTCKYIRCD